jgi:hypothetical protein
MAAGDISKALSDELGLRLEDPQEATFSQSTKIAMLNKGQVQLVNMLHDAFLTELESVSTAQTLTTQALALSSLNTGLGVLRGGEGIKRVLVKVGGTGNGVWSTEINIDELKKLENSYLAYSDARPLHYIFQSKINILITTYTATTIDVFFMKVPLILSAAVDPILNNGLFGLVITLAEAQCWAMDAKIDRRNSALDIAFKEIQILNSRYQRAEGVGTKNRERTEGK